jgi:hypothetical protein
VATSNRGPQRCMHLYWAVLYPNFKALLPAQCAAYLAVEQLVEGVVQVNVPSTTGNHKVTLQNKQPQITIDTVWPCTCGFRP